MITQKIFFFILKLIQECITTIDSNYFILSSLSLIESDLLHLFVTGRFPFFKINKKKKQRFQQKIAYTTLRGKFIDLASVGILESLALDEFSIEWSIVLRQ